MEVLSSRVHFLLKPDKTLKSVDVPKTKYSSEELMADGGQCFCPVLFVASEDCC